MYETITLDHRDGVSTVTVNRPPLNLMTPQTLTELDAAFATLAARDETRAVVLTGAGSRAFCAGANLDDKPRQGGDPSDSFRERGRAVLERIETFPKPVVAAIRGWAIGGGFALSQACDIRLAAENAKFRTGDAYIGVVPSWGMSMVRLVHYIGRNRTLDLLMLGEDIDARQAHELGLVTRVMAGEAFDAEVARTADRLASGAPLVFQAIKQAVWSQYYESPAAAHHLETHWSKATQTSSDYREGIAAFKEKRKPLFKGTLTMDFALSKAQRDRREAAREIVERVVTPIVESVPPGGMLAAEHWRSIYQALAPLGYLGSTLPREIGGAGLSYVDYGLLLEALADGPIILGEIVPPRTINYLGSDEQRRRWLPKLLAGDWVSTAAITEPQAGSDLRGLKTTAIAEADGFRVNGAKKWIKLGGISDFMTLLVVTGSDEDGKPKTSRLCHERTQSPWIAKEHPATGLDKVSFAELRFDNVRVPRENLLGEPGRGAEQFNRGIEASRALVGLQATGLARRALDRAIAYAKERFAFGRPLAKFQAIQTALADAATRLEAARLLCLKALASLDAGRRVSLEVSMAKLFATETAVEVCHAAMDSMGAHGLSREAGVERCWRDSRMLTVIDGTSGIQRLIVGRDLFGVPAFT